MKEGTTLVLVERRPPVASVTLNRPAVRNALSFALMDSLASAVAELDRDPEVRAIVICGAGGVFAAGADIAELAEATPAGLLGKDGFLAWRRLRETKKPLIAAVEGLALGGGMELAMLCDLIVAGEGARFGQPEIRLGVMPGAGGTQLLTRMLGKWRAMEMVLTGRLLTGRELHDAGLVTRVVPDSQALREAERLAREVARSAPIAAMLAKEAVGKAFMGTLEEGLDLERKNFYLLLATKDREEGMRAFLEKREAHWQGN